MRPGDEEMEDDEDRLHVEPDFQPGEMIYCIGSEVSSGTVVCKDRTGCYWVCKSRPEEETLDVHRLLSCPFCHGHRDHVRYNPDDLYRDRAEAEVKVCAILLTFKGLQEEEEE